MFNFHIGVLTFFYVKGPILSISFWGFSRTIYGNQ